jgi:hypothetical protein
MDGYTPDHIDGNKVNNALSNLEWVSKSEQILRQGPRVNVGVTGCGRPVTATNDNGERFPFRNASLALDWVGKVLHRSTLSGVTYILSLAKSGSDGNVPLSRGHGHVWKFSEEGELLDALEWRQVPPSFVQGNITVFCSELGHVRANGRRATLGGTRGPYLHTSIRKLKKLRTDKDETRDVSRSYEMHRLIAFAWHGSPPNENDVVDHFDGNPHNNRQDNLGWINKGENGHRASLQESPIQKINPNTDQVVKTYTDYMEAVRDTGIIQGIGASVYSIKRGVKSHEGRLVVGGWKFCNPSRLVSEKRK